MSALRHRPLPDLQSVLRPLLAALLLGTIVLSSASPAVADAVLVDSNPERRSTLETLPAEIRLTFTGEMNRPSYVTLSAPDGSTVVEGEGDVEGNDVVQAVTDDPGLAGTYRVDYRVVSADGHPVSGGIEFDVTSGKTVQAGAPDRSTGSSPWWIVWVTVPWIVLLAFLVLRRRRRPTA